MIQQANIAVRQQEETVYGMWLAFLPATDKSV